MEPSTEKRGKMWQSAVKSRLLIKDEGWQRKESVMLPAERPEPGRPLDELTGWKEIADYLGVSQRTARNWERDRHLPIRRRGTIAVALLEELEQWRRQSLSPPTSSGIQTAPRLTQATGTSSRILFTAITLGTLAVLAMGGWLYRTVVVVRRGPAELAVQGKSLIVKNERGEEMWRHSFPYALHEDSYYPAALPNLTWIGDIDGDGRSEVLAVFMSVNNLAVGTPLICFSEDGKIKWQYSGGRQLQVDNHVLSGIYFSDIIALPDRRQVIVRSNHSMRSPQQVALLDGAGRVVGEYWHSGHLRNLLLADIDGKGNKDLLMPGIDDDLGQATLVVLPLNNVPSPVTPAQSDFRMLTSRGGERAKVLFPKSCISKRLEPTNRAFRVRVTPAGIEVDVYESHTERGNPPLLSYTLDRDFRALDVLVSSTFLARHKELEAERKLDHEFSDTEIDHLKREVVVKFP